MTRQHRDEVDRLLRPVLSGLPGAATLLSEAVTAPGNARRRPCGKLAKRCHALDGTRTRTLAQVTRVPPGMRGETIKVVQTAAVTQRQMLAVARVAARAGGRLPEGSVRCSSAVLQMAEKVVAVGLAAGADPDGDGSPSPSGDEVRLRPIPDPANPHRREVVRVPLPGNSPVEVRLADAIRALEELSAQLDAMMGHVVIPVQWRFHAPDEPRQPMAGGWGRVPERRFAEVGAGDSA